jgi:glycosyltransferase involved in cell wall biosynthesis
MPKIVFCQATFRDDFEGTKRCIERVSPNVDATVIVYDQTLTEEQIGWLYAAENIKKYRLYPVFHEFNDDLPEMRNRYLKKARELGADWVCVSDPDELYSEELAKNLRRLIERYDAEGYNLLPVPVRDQFDNVEWLDDVELLKEVPGGYREVDYWKPLLIFKLYPDTHYEGVGVEGKVHETLRSGVPWKPMNLPREYYYTHMKSALRIWRNAARNLYIAGGGDNVGSLNRYWVRLRQICSRLGIKTWNEFEEFVRRGTDDEEFHGWLKDALQAPPTSWGTETRECAKWYFALHGEQITPEVRRLIETRPALTPEIEAENYVTSMYFKILGRHPDEEGKRHYTQLILEGKMSREDLPKILMASDEYRARSAGVPSAPGVVERMKIQVPVDVYVRLDERTFVEALRRSRVYWEVVKPKIDVGDLILGRLSPVKQAEFKRWFYVNRDAIGPRDIAEWVEENMMRPNSIALCIMGFDGALPMIVENIKVTGPYVDEIHVQGDDFSEGSVRILEDLGAEVHIVPWEDNFSDYKNKAISYANTEWVLICDHDEIPTEEMARALRDIVERSDRGRRFNMVGFDVVDVWTEDGKVVSENRSSGGKALLHWNVPEPYYGNPHIWLKPNYYPWKAIHVPYAYRHVKDRGSILPNSVRNVFLGGGGDNVRERNPLWVELRALTRELGIDTWGDFHRYLKRGDIDDRILNVLRRMAEMPWKDDELKDPLRYYYQLHPEERNR